MLYRPISAYPSNGVSIDADDGNVSFYTIIQGASSVVTGYRVILYDADTLEEVKTSDKFDLTPPLTAGNELSFNIKENISLENGKSYFWKLRLYQNPKDIFITNSEIQDGNNTDKQIIIREHYNVSDEMYVTVNGEQRKIERIDVNKDKSVSTITLDESLKEAPSKGVQVKIHSDFVDSVQFGFCTNKIPILKLKEEDKERIHKSINSRSGTFNMAFYNKNDSEEYSEVNIPIRWHRFMLFLKEDNSDEMTIVEDTGYVYNSNISFTFEGFVNYKTYVLSCSVETTAGVLVNSESYEFDINYAEADLQSKLNVTDMPEQHAVKIDWLPGDFSEGRISDGGKYRFEESVDEESSFKEKALIIDKGYMVWDSVDENPIQLYEDEYSVLTDVTFETNLIGNIITMDKEGGGELRIHGDGLSINYSNGEKSGSLGNFYNEEVDGLQDKPEPEEYKAYMCWKTKTINKKETPVVCEREKYCVKSIKYKMRYKVSILNDEVKIKMLARENIVGGEK